MVNKNYNSEYYKNHKAKILNRTKRWRKLNKEKYIKQLRNQHSKIMFGGNKEKVLERDNFQCQNCGLNQEQHIVIYGYGLIVHHKDGNGKDSKNPNNDLNNLQALCRKCHTSIHNKQRIGDKNPMSSKARYKWKVKA
jgi:5-methylcytosine-specific restriction endonuclease McrA